MNKIKIIQLLELVWVKALLNLKSEASINYLSYAWWVVEPLLHMIIYYVVFGFLLNAGGEDYVPFLLTGLIPWLWVAKAVSHAMNSIVQGQHLMNQLFIPKIFFPLTNVIQDSLKQVMVMILLILFLVFYGYTPSLNWFWLFPIFISQFILILSLSLLSALVIPFVRDFSFIIPTTLQFVMFCSGIFYDYKSISEKLHNIFFINPFAGVLRNYREVFIDNIQPNLTLLAYTFFCGIVLFILSLFLYKKYEYTLPRVVLE